MAFPTQNIETMNSGMMNNSGYLTNDIREMRLQNMYMRYGMGGNQAQFDPNQTYATIPGMTDEDSQNVGRIASAIGTAGNTSYVPPVNQFAQVLLNNKPLLGAASNFAEGFAKALQTPPPMSEQEKLKGQYLQSEIDRNNAMGKMYEDKAPGGEVSGSLTLNPNWNTIANGYTNGTPYKNMVNVVRLYNDATLAFNDQSHTPQDDWKLATLAQHAMNPASIRQIAQQPEPAKIVEFLRGLGVGSDKANILGYNTKSLDDDTRQKLYNMVVQGVKAYEPEYESFLNSKRNVMAKYPGVDSTQIADMIPDLRKGYVSPLPINTQPPAPVSSSFVPDDAKYQRALVAAQSGDTGAQNYITLYKQAKGMQ